MKVIYKIKERRMNEQKTYDSLTRRRFLLGVAPACAVTCLGIKHALTGASVPEVPPFQEKGHKFDMLYDRRMTYRQFFTARTRRFIEFAQFLEAELGKDRLIELIEKHTLARTTRTGQNLAKRAVNNSLSTFSRILKDPSTNIIMDIIEDNETVFEMRVRECLEAETYLQQKAGDIGHAHVCLADFSVIQAFNPKIKLIRDKTLMQRHDCCNHRYVLTR